MTRASNALRTHDPPTPYFCLRTEMWYTFFSRTEKYQYIARLKTRRGSHGESETKKSLRKWKHQGSNWREKLQPETLLAGAWVNTTLKGGSRAGEAPCRGGPVPLQVVELGARTGLGNSQGDYMGRCSGNSQASRSTCITYTHIPVSHPLGWGKPVSSSSKNENTQSRRPAIKVPCSVAHLFWQWKHCLSL